MFTCYPVVIPTWYSLLGFTWNSIPGEARCGVFLRNRVTYRDHLPLDIFGGWHLSIGPSEILKCPILEWLIKGPFIYPKVHIFCPKWSVGSIPVFLRNSKWTEIFINWFAKSVENSKWWKMIPIWPVNSRIWKRKSTYKLLRGQKRRWEVPEVSRLPRVHFLETFGLFLNENALLKALRSLTFGLNIFRLFV